MLRVVSPERARGRYRDNSSAWKRGLRWQALALRQPEAHLSGVNGTYAPRRCHSRQWRDGRSVA